MASTWSSSLTGAPDTDTTCGAADNTGPDTLAAEGEERVGEMDDSCLDRDDSMDLSGDETAIIKDSSVADSAVIEKNNTELSNFPVEGLLTRREDCLEKGSKGERDGKSPREGKCKDAASHSGSVKKIQEQGKKDQGPSFKPQYMAIKTSRERKEGSQTLGKIGNFSRTGWGGSVGGGGCGRRWLCRRGQH
jgi:hypothetical protein